ncbi:MAG: response regulator [Ferruginibacter sp.]
MSVIVIIVDDDEGVRFFHRIIVSQSELCAEPLSFGYGEELLEYLDKNSDEADNFLILLDINMPGMNGWDIMDAISDKSYHSRVHIVVVTSSVDWVEHEKARSYSMVIDILEKPISDAACKRIMNYPSIAQYFSQVKK